MENDFNYPSNLPQSESIRNRHLKKDAVPSVFHFPDNMKKKPVVKRNPKKRELQPSESHTLHDPPAPKIPRPDHTYSSYISPRKFKKEFTLKIRKKNLTIHNLRRKNLRKEKTIKGLMKLLENAKLVSEESCSSLINNFGHMAANLFKNELKNNKEVSG